MDRLYIVTYDICDQTTWRLVFKTMQGYGEWLQLSVFQCRLGEMELAQMIADLDIAIDHGEDTVMIFDIGNADKSDRRVVSLGKSAFRAIIPEATIV